MEAESASVRPVPPNRLRNHPGVAKAWVRYTNASTLTIANSYNVTSVTDNGVGDATVNFTTAMSSTSYAAVAMGGASAGRSFTSTAFNTGSVRVQATVSTSGAADDMSFNSVVVFGDQ
jgi:hypothetical protein